MLSHIKPGHLSKQDRPDHITTPEKLMRAARNSGYEVVVASTGRRRSRAVSSWEMHARSAADTEAEFCLPGDGLVEKMAEEKRLWQRGLRAAVHERLKVIELSFENVTRGLCAAVKRTTLALEPSASARGGASSARCGRSRSRGARLVLRFELTLQRSETKNPAKVLEQAELERQIPSSKLGLLRCVANGAEGGAPLRWQRQSHWEDPISDPQHRRRRLATQRIGGGARHRAHRTVIKRVPFRPTMKPAAPAPGDLAEALEARSSTRCPRSSRTRRTRRSRATCAAPVPPPRHDALHGLARRRRPRARGVDCFLGNHFEPFVVVRRCDEATPRNGSARVPRFDERFTGYGKNKIEWISSLRGADYAFYTVASAFAVHATVDFLEDLDMRRFAEVAKACVLDAATCASGRLRRGAAAAPSRTTRAPSSTANGALAADADAAAAAASASLSGVASPSVGFLSGGALTARAGPGARRRRGRTRSARRSAASARRGASTRRRRRREAASAGRARRSALAAGVAVAKRQVEVALQAEDALKALRAALGAVDRQRSLLRGFARRGRRPRRSPPAAAPAAAPRPPRRAAAPARRPTAAPASALRARGPPHGPPGARAAAAAGPAAAAASAAAAGAGAAAPRPAAAAAAAAAPSSFEMEAHRRMHREMLTRQHDQLALFDEAGLARAPSPDRRAPAPAPRPRRRRDAVPDAAAAAGRRYPALEASFDLGDDGADGPLFDFLNA
ncbi:hypothetical protein JL720_16749 [Aureococcus anophagefferens]|nr:hypothetical protein JL720_16749 [Aureococcus anophagefferens]